MVSHEGAIKNKRPGGLPAPNQGVCSESSEYSIVENSDPVKLKNLPEVWATFLNQPEWEWSLYGHFTFRDTINQQMVHPEYAGKAWDRFIHKLNREIFGCRYYKRASDGVTWARASEDQRRGAIHYHAIIGRVPGEIRRLDLMDRWFEMAGIARIQAYEVGRGAEFYMSKSCYAWKRGEIDLGGPLAEMKGSFIQQRLCTGKA